MHISKKMFFNALVIGATLIVGISPLVSADTTQAASDKVLVTVDGNPITQATYDRHVANRPNRDRKTIIDELVKREVLLQDAIKHGLDKQPDVIAELATLRENLLVGIALKVASENISSSDEELHKFYNDHLKELSVTEYKARHILVSTEEEAKTIIDELNKGADFAKLAKEKSKDNSAEGGDLGWFNSSQMVKPFSDAIVALPKGKYSDHPVNTEFGWHVILHEDTRETAAPPFDKVKDRIKMAVQRSKLQEYVQHLQSQAKVEIKD
jgi:peptidyl-prolyl cis-trans isomerase C